MGLPTVISGKWPVPSHGSLVIMISPSSSCSSGNFSRKQRMVRGAVPINEGIPLEAWAMELPLASVITQAKSLDSRTIDENEVRTREAAASSTVEMSRRHNNSSVMLLSVECFIGHVYRRH